jgi:hypothetical protein
VRATANNHDADSPAVAYGYDTGCMVPSDLLIVRAAAFRVEAQIEVVASGLSEKLPQLVSDALLRHGVGRANDEQPSTTGEVLW